MSRAAVRLTAALIAVLAWAGLAIQLFVLLRMASRNGTSPVAALGRFLCYFTILTNLLVALSTTSVARRSAGPDGRGVGAPRVEAALAVYIVIVGLVYHLVLRALWRPTGLQLVADVLLHTVVPVGYVAYWLACVPKGRLRWGDIALWLIYPVAYAVFTVVHGAIVHWYPYPFVDAQALGYGRVALNAVLLTVVFIGGGLAAVLVDRRLAPKRAAV